jgi:hypothetical protein
MAVVPSIREKKVPRALSTGRALEAAVTDLGFYTAPAKGGLAGGRVAPTSVGLPLPEKVPARERPGIN